MPDETSMEKILSRQKEQELREAEDRLDRIKTILGSVQNGWSVALYRRSPGWAEGHLETKRIVGDGEALDLDYIAQQWGGEIIQIRIQDEHGKYVHSTEIPFRSYPPKTWGKELVHPNYRHLETEKKSEVRDPLSSLDGILGIIEKLKSSEPKSQNLDMKILELLLRQQAQPMAQVSPLAGLEQAIQMVTMMKELGSAFGQVEKPTDENDMFGKIGGLLEIYSKIKGQEKPVPKIAPPRPVPPPIGPVGNPGSAQKPAPNVAEELATMDPESAAGAVLLALDRMPEDKRERALAVFFHHLGIEEEDEPVDTDPETVQNLHNGPSATSKGADQGR